jgi:hypothetical protein
VPSVLTPQTRVPDGLAVTAAKVPAGGEIVPAKSSPQQERVPSVLTPQAKRLPALTDTKVPAGGVVSPKELSPQQATVPSFLNPQATPLPTLTDTKATAGAVAGRASRDCNKHRHAKTACARVRGDLRHRHVLRVSAPRPTALRRLYRRDLRVAARPRLAGPCLSLPPPPLHR